MSGRIILCGPTCGHEHNSLNGPTGCCAKHGPFMYFCGECHDERAPSVRPDTPAQPSTGPASSHDGSQGATTEGGRCRADRDGECSWSGCPQLRDGEPAANGRHCPIDTWEDAR